MKKTREKAKAEKRKKTLEKLGMRDEVGGSMEKLGTVLKDKKVQKATNVAKGAVAIGAGVLIGGVPGIALAVAGIAKGISKKGPIADTMESRGKGEKIRKAEEEKEKIDQGVGEKRASQLKSAEDEKKANLQNIEIKKQEKLTDAKTSFDTHNNETMYNNGVKKINEDAENKSKDVNEKFEKKKEEVNTHRQGDLNSANSRVEIARSKQGAVGKFMESTGKEMKGPNHFTIKAVELATGENRKVHKTVSDLGEEDTHEFDKRDFHSPGGPNSQQQKLFDALNSSTAEAAKAIKKMTDSVKSMPQNIGDAQRQTILSLKQMMAAQSAAGKSMGKFSNLISELDKQSDIQDKKGNATVEAMAKTFSAETKS